MQTRQRKASFYKTEDEKEPAKEWLDSLKDILRQSKILTRIKRAETGNFGDHKGIGETGNLIILLMGGDKSTQAKDIEKAKLF